MKFLTKKADSDVLKQNLVYKKGSNKELRELLLKEQFNFCAYSEKYIGESEESLESVVVEHFNPDDKWKDDYYNYYAVIAKMNEHKIGTFKKYKESSFFKSKFFQNKENFNQRIEYTGGIYLETSEDDSEAKDLIDYLGFNAQMLCKVRNGHIAFLRQTFKDAGYSKEKQVDFFRKHKQHLDFITAIEVELELDLSEFYN